MIKVKENRDQTERFDTKVDKKTSKGPSRNRRKSFGIGWTFTKEEAPGRLYKSTTENKSFFNRDRTFIVSERSKLNDNIYLYWFKENGWKIENRFLRQELFTLKNQFVE